MRIARRAARAPGRRSVFWSERRESPAGGPLACKRSVRHDACCSVIVSTAFWPTCFCKNIPGVARESHSLNNCRLTHDSRARTGGRNPTYDGGRRCSAYLCKSHTRGFEAQRAVRWRLAGHGANYDCEFLYSSRLIFLPKRPYNLLFRSARLSATPLSSSFSFSISSSFTSFCFSSSSSA